MLKHQHGEYRHDSAKPQTMMELLDQSRLLLSQKDVLLEKKFWWKYIYVSYRKEYLLVRVTAPVKTIANTSRTRKMKKSHLFFWTKMWKITPSEDATKN